jgi:molybdenum cofactor cytidylyltransferase
MGHRSRIQDLENPGMEKEPTAGIILAAGMSTRFGSLKPLFKIGENNILTMVIDASLESKLDEVVLVLGYRADTIMEAIGEKLRHTKLKTVINPYYTDGMSVSIQRGLKEIKDEFPSIMIILGDHPLLKPGIIDLLVNRYRSSDKSICLPVYKGVRGHPVCFSEEFYPALMAIRGDIGARDIIRENPGEILEVELDDSDPFLGVDDNEDITELASKLKNRGA